MSDYSGSEQNLEVFMSQDWITANLGWDFETVWTMTGTDDYPLPVLDGFAAFGGMGVPEQCEHSYGVTDRVDATCVTSGYVRYTCNNCGDWYEEIIAALGHTTDNGVCERCGETFEAPKADLWDGTVADGFGGGSGTEDDPYLIFTGAQLAYLASGTNSGNSYSGRYFKLMNNLDLNGLEWTPIGKGKDYNSSTYAFSGYFDGNGMVISNFTQTNSRQFSGLFGVICNASVSNLGIHNAYIHVEYDGSYCLAGGLAGSAAESKLTNCYVTNSTIYAKYSGLCVVGGLVGELYASKEAQVSNCFANCEVTAYGGGNTAAGGLIGIVDWDGGANVYRIDSCYAVGTVYSDCAAGGFIGQTWSDVVYVSYSFSNANITGGSPRGAFIGKNNNATLYVSNCYYGNAQSNSVGSASSISAESFQSYEWISSTLGWDFANVWTFDYASGYEYPVLQGFGIGGDVHVHDWTEAERVEPTCGVEGYVRYTCTECNYTYDETLPALEHQFAESERVEPTCQTEGYVRYTCSLCGDYYDDVLPTVRHEVGEDNYCTMCGEYIDQRPADILIVEDDDAWDKNSNQKLMENLLAAGMINSYKIVSGSSFHYEDLNAYSVLYIVMNDDVLSPSQVNGMYEKVIAFLDAGGTVIYGLAWHGQRNVTLPAGAVATYTDSGRYGYIADQDNPIVTGELTDGVRFPDNTPGDRLSHSYISYVPENANVILKNENSSAILVEYAYGNGNVILSCLTWECFYQTNYNDVVFSSIAYDDLIVYAAALAGSGVGGNIHAHNYVETERTEPTCWVEGYILYTCTECDRFYEETLPALEHQYTESERVEPNCQDYGYIRYTCTMCGDYYDETLYILSHTYAETERVEPTCQTEGYVRYTCAMCGDYYDETLYQLSHEYTETERVEPTCQTEGYVRYTCAMCGDYYDDVLSTIRHKIGEDNCCTMCGEYIDQRPADILVVQNGEPWGSGSNQRLMQNLLSAGSINSYNIVTDSTFHSMDLNAYSVIYVVMNSDALYSSSVNAMYDKLVDFISAGGTVIYGMCWQSNQSTTTLPAGAEVVKVNGHYGTIVDYDHPIMSGELTDGIRFPDRANGNSLNHTYVSVIPENANVILKDDNGHVILVEYGYGNGNVILSCLTWEYYYQTTNSYAYYSYDDLIVYAASLSGSGLGGGDNVCKHSYVEIEKVEPTCTTDGYTKYACEHCGNEYTGDYVSRWGHTVGEWIIDYEPTCTTSGRKHSECAVCGQQLENIYISSLGHSYVTVVTREVTCTTPGVLTHTCERCGDSYSTYVYSEHAYTITQQVQPTCYTDGYTVYTCSNCGDYYTETIPGGHDYKSAITKVATSEEDGEITYTCEACGDSYTEVIPAREAANVLLVQDKYPWGENNNAALLNQMLTDGYITGWDLTTTSNFANVDLGAYNVILIANDQSSATYDQLNQLNDTLKQFATAGGVIIYGACDSGWSGGYINYSLPEGVVKKNFYSRYNYIVDGDHLIVSGILTDGKALTDNLLNGNYCSHSAFEANTLPAGANVILQDAHGDATLVEYAVGDGYVILSGLTWEFYYNRNCYDGRTNTSYTKNVYDDLVMYALYLSDPCEHIYDEGEIVAPTCTEDGYTKHTCQNCGATMKDTVVEALGHTEGEWAVTVEPTQYAEGLKELCCTVCGEVLKSEILPPVGGAAARVESDFDYVVIGDEIVFTLVIENCDPIKSLSVVPVFDSDVFEIVSAEWLLADAMIQNIEEGTYKSVSVWSYYIDVNCAVYRITLKAKQFTDDASVTFSLMVEDKEGVVTVVPKSVSVTECPHAHTSVEQIDGTYHANVCDLCGYAVMEEHIYDDIYDLVCDACGYERACQHPDTYVMILDEQYHGHVCYYCGRAETEEHVYDDAYDLVCDACGYTRACEHPDTYIGMTDDHYHAHVCYYCGNVETEAHSYDGIYDLVCDTCGYTRACEHPDTFTVKVNGAYHAHVCNVCGNEERAEHIYDNGYDLVCDECGYERECPHTDCYVECVDGICHVHVCKNCGYQKTEEHIYGDNGVICKECGYANVIKGDVDNDGDVDSDDAVYLVYNVFFGEDYPVVQGLDFDGDGSETTDDAIYLLYFIYFGEASYPLH